MDTLARVAPLALARPDFEELWLGDKTEATRDGYRRDLLDFAAHVGLPPAVALEAFLALDAGAANAAAVAYRNALIAQKLAPATINRRLSALRSVVSFGRKIGRVTWALDVDGVGQQKYRDTSGPGVDAVRALRAAATSPRDRALLALLFLCGLRRVEIARLELEHVDLVSSRLWILGKGRREREALPLRPAVVRDLRAWIAERGEEPGALFGITTGGGVYDWLARLCAVAGVKARPHGVRHTAITEVLARNNGNIAQAQRFARHADPRVTSRYNDNREAAAGEASALLEADWDEEP